jgi:Ferroportin1 (FPN1)
VTTLAALTLSSTVGRWVDAHASRIKTLQISIFFQRISVVLACIGWIFVVGEGFVSGSEPNKQSKVKDGIIGNHGFKKGAIFGVIVLLGATEKLTAIANMIVMERDWVTLLMAHFSVKY